jgi:3-hydroxyisobutyrate dehydrogenase
MTNKHANEITVAFLGVGQMGAPMAARLIAAGFNVRVWNRSKTRVEELVRLGGIEASTPSTAAASADVVITMLPDGLATENVMEGADGAFATVPRGALWLQMGTIGIEWTEQFKKSSSDEGVLFVDAPVSGSVVPASAGQLLILASGPNESHVRAERVFKVLGRHTFWLGDAGAGSRAKLVLNNWLVDLVELTAETLNVATALGLDPRGVVKILADAPIGSPYAVAKARNMLDGDFSSSFALKHAVKDASLALEAARSVDQELPLTSSLISTWQRALADGAGDLDLSVIYRYMAA